ncbi:diuretic hormone receptor-like [Oratosquilla oratoria]|uniref:diuretic hormone receptor-like n=1 Tax=Oratosquilla oratoria TaxID=337810 RepID=UPI003F770247
MIILIVAREAGSKIDVYNDLVLVRKLQTTARLDPPPRCASHGVRALRSLLVLMPLLGTPHLLLLLGPQTGTLGIFLEYVRAIVLSSQGLVVTLLYCFLNSEVRDSFTIHVERWKSTRDIPPGSAGSVSLKNLDGKLYRVNGITSR